MVIRISAEQAPENFRIPAGLCGPSLPHLIAQGISDEVRLGPLGKIVRAVAGRLGITVLRGIKRLGGQKAQMFPPELPPKRGDMMACLVRLAVHGRTKESSVLHDDGQLAVVKTQLRLYWRVSDDRVKACERELTRSLRFELPHTAIRSSTMSTLKKVRRILPTQNLMTISTFAWM